MQALTIDASMGASGDMLLGLFLDLGADRTRLDPIATAIDADVSVERVDRTGIAATSVDVRTASAPSSRTPDEVIALIESVDLEPTVRATAIEAVELLAAAEATVHGRSIDNVHFHEVGADDAIFDICGTVALLDDLAIDTVLVGPVATGSGWVETSHGTYPIPPPAVTQLAVEADWIVHPGPVEAELLTPTGAALLAVLAEGVETLPPMTLERTGYGAGDRTFPDRPNLLRGFIGTLQSGLTREPITLLETVVDDVTPETLGGLQETLVEAGARDITILPTTMKKARPGHLVQVVVPPEAADAVAHRLAVETGTLGIREIPLHHRWVAKRAVETVDIVVDGERYEIGVKIATDAAGDRIDVSAEHDDALEVACATKVPLREVRRRAEAAALEQDR